MREVLDDIRLEAERIRLEKKIKDYLKKEKATASCENCCFSFSSGCKEGKKISQEGCVWCRLHERLFVKTASCGEWRDLELEKFKARVRSYVATYGTKEDMVKCEEFLEKLQNR